MAKRPSGAEFRKLKKVREEEDRKNANRKLMDKYIASGTLCSTKSQLETVEEVLSAEAEELPIPSSEQAIPSSSSELSELPTILKPEELPISEENSEWTSLKLETISLNYNDITSWPRICDNFRRRLVAHGPDQGKDVDFKTLPMNESGRKFTKDWFFGTQRNGEKIESI